MSHKLSRRQFLGTSAVSATAAGFWLTGGVTESHAAQNPNDRLNIAVIGCGGQGASDLGNVSGENIVALCDVDENRARDSFAKYPKVPKYKDFRQMFDKQGKEIQAVTVSTPDHTHAYASIMAMRLGKHVYCQKPLTHDVWEARLMGQVAQKQRVATQMGNQGTASSELRSAAELIRGGAIGDVSVVHCWTDRPGMYWRQGWTERPKERPAVPKTLDWDLWIGTAPTRPYNPAYAPFAWRGWWDFGTGALGDMACHIMNLPWMALQLTAPSSVVAELDHPNTPESPPNGLRVTYEFPARGNRRAVRMIWYESSRPPENLFGRLPISSGGSLFIGARGKLYSRSDYGGSNVVLLSDSSFQDYRAPAQTERIPRSPGQHAEWIRACKGGPPPMSNFTDYAGPLTEMVLLGNVAIRVGSGQRVVWNSEKLQAVDLPAANRFLKREYRKGWELRA